jgi:FkbM family methyltransferase
VIRSFLRRNRKSDLRSRLLQERGVSVALDIGANEGNFARRLRESGYAGRIVSFEPLAAMYEKLQAASDGDPDWSSLNVAVGAEPGRATLNRAANWASSSLLPMNPRHSEAEPRSAYMGTEDCEVVTLDGLRSALLDGGERLYLKLDVQGFELEVLRGAARTLDQVEVVQAELSLVPLYNGAPLFDEVVRYLDERGFGLFAIEPGFADPRTGALLQVDGLLARV